MTTASTRSRSRKPSRASATNPSVSKEPASSETDRVDVGDHTWRRAAIVILLITAFLRVYDLALVPLHHDEGVNGNFLLRLVREGFYQYDPSNYHGPTLYYFSAVIPWLARLFGGVDSQTTYGLHTVTIRLIPALFGIGTVWLVLILRRHIGGIGSLCAASLLAISPGAVYLSRYFIHETLFVFFTLGIVITVLKYFEGGHPAYLVLSSLSAALLFATKETAFISVGVLVIALGITYIYPRLVNTKKNQATAFRNFNRGTSNELAWFWLLVAVIVFIGVNVLFYSSFFSNYPKGVYDSLKTFEFWTKTGKQAHVQPAATYGYWLLRQEAPILFSAVLGGLFAVIRPRNAFALFSALWAFGILAAYSLVPYKTPWLVLNFVVPLAIVGGYAFQVFYHLMGNRLSILSLLLLFAIGVSGYKSVDLNFYNYDNDDSHYVYVYAHTRRELHSLVDAIERIAERTGERGSLGITITSPDYWPLPWYLRNYSRVGYYGRLTSTNEPVIVASTSQREDIERTHGEKYQQVSSSFNLQGSFPLRPGVDLLVYHRRDLPVPP